MTRSESAPQRVSAAAILLHDLWGDDLPPGRAPWERIVADVLAADDDFGERHGLAVQGDELDLAVLAELLSYVPTGASLRTAVPPALTDRMQQAAAVRDPDALRLTVGDRLLSEAIRAVGCRCAAVFTEDSGHVDLQVSFGLMPWERLNLRRVRLPGDGPLCRALQSSQTVRGEIPSPPDAPGGPSLGPAPCIAAPFPGAGEGQPTHGVLLLIFSPGDDPDPELVGLQVATLAAELEHLVAAL